MAIQFPPVNIGDLPPEDGDTYLYLITQEEFVCHRRSPFEAAQWASKGLINPTSFGYRGNVEILKEAPDDANKGNIYSVIDGGIADASFVGLSGNNIPQWTLIIYNEPNWVPINVDSGNVVQGPWVRTSDGEIKPSVPTDNLDMESGNIQINEFPEL